MNKTQEVVKRLLDTGLTKYRIAKDLGVQQITVTNWERGTIMRISNMRKVKEVYGIDMMQEMLED